MTPEGFDSIRQAYPDATRLAEALSLAVRVEPELVRQMRLALFPKSAGSLEADLYFSPLVGQRTADWLALNDEFAQYLRDRLANGDRLAAGRVRDIVRQAHAGAPPEMACEEDVIWIAVSRPLGRTQALEAIDARLRDVLMPMLAEDERATALARWFASAALRLPPEARETEAYRLMVFAASSLLGGRNVDAGVTPTLDLFEQLSRYPLRASRTVGMWAALTTRGLHLRPDQAAGYREFQAPLTSPVLLEVRPEAGLARLVQVTPGQAAFVPLERGPLAVRTLAREVLRLTPKVARAADAVPGFGARGQGGVGLRIFVSYARQDAEFVAALTRDLKGSGHQVWIYQERLAGIADFDTAIRNAIQEASCVLAILGPFSAGSSYAARELDFAVKSGVPVIPIRRDYVTPNPPYLLLQSIDFRNSRPYQEALQELKERLEHLPARESPLPALPPYFVGRQQAMDHLRRSIQPGSTPMITAVVGRGGIGKTTLAAAFARDESTRERFTGGILWVNAGDALPRLESRDNQAPLLIILDDLESPEILGRVVAIRGPQWALLFTARVIPAYTEDLRTSPVVVSLGPMTMEEALELLRRASGQTELPPAAQRVVEACQGVPLALRRAGLRVRDGANWEEVLEDKGGGPVQFDLPRLVQALAQRRNLREDASPALEQLLGFVREDDRIDRPAMVAFLLAVVETETGSGFRPLSETGSPETFQRYEPNTPEGNSLGNTEAGDGYRFRGRGYLLVTGRANYTRVSSELGMEDQLVRDPDLMLQPRVAYDALASWLTRRRPDGKGLAEFLSGTKPDYLSAAITANSGSAQASRIAGASSEIEPIVYSCLTSGPVGS